jgi:hypothetical protein
MRPLNRALVSLLGLLWLTALTVIIWWHFIWAPLMAVAPLRPPAASPHPEPARAGRLPLPVDVGTPFDIRDDFGVSAGTSDDHVVIAVTGAPTPPSGAGGLHAAWYIGSLGTPGTGVSTVSTRHDSTGPEPAIEVTLSDLVYCPIDSQRAGPARLTALVGERRRPADAEEDARSWGRPVDQPGSSLLVRVQNPEFPWGGCYAVTYNWLIGTLDLARYDTTGTVTEGGRLPRVFSHRTLLGSAAPKPLADTAELWLACDGPRLTAGLGRTQLLTAQDATYPVGHVGFGAQPGYRASFRSVRLQGRPPVP